jgi:hypothetical protein
MIILILILIIILLIFYYKSDYFTNNHYLSKNELIEILINNSDNYYNTFNSYDFKVRNINSIEDYYIKIKNSATEINNNFDNIIDNINNKLKKINIIGFDGEKASKIPWIIGFIDGVEYEYGFPHTRNNIIVIPIKLINSNRLEKILIHEKIHIYQK